MITFTPATLNSIKDIQEIVHITWPITYGTILSKEQLDYMLALFYSEEALAIQISENKQLFYILHEDDLLLGFIGIEHQYTDLAVTRIHKIYLLPEAQGKGAGKAAISFIAEEALKKNATSLSLNVNRFNTALHFYKKTGFVVTAEVNIAIGNGYLMEDYVMEKKL